MHEPSPRAPFDQGLFLTHFNKGKDHYDAKRYVDAERELEEAYLLRPRDQKVLNLLGLVYFKQEKFEKAEEVYRKLASESPDAHTLFYNLGLIYFKLQRLEEAESAFLKALELTKENPKINFYLGSIYERMKRYQDAIFQYRQAGANIMVRRVEDKLAAAAAQPQAPAPASADTAKYRVADVQEALRRAEQAMAPPKRVEPVSPALMAPGAPPPDTAKFRLSEIFPAAPESAPGRHPEIISFPQRAAGPASVATDRTLPPQRRPEPFRFLDNRLMEIEVAGKVFIKQGTIYSYGGNLTFWVKERRPGGQAPLVIITGTGKLILTDREREITFMTVQEETVHVEPGHLLACEASLTPRYVSVASGLDFLALEGSGMVALSVVSKPLTLTVTPDLPVSVPASSVITWSGAIKPYLVEDRQLYEVMVAPGRDTGPLIRLEGSGRLLVEQQSG